MAVLITRPPVPVTPGGAVLGSRRPAPHEWIESSGFDLAFFILAPLRAFRDPHVRRSLGPYLMQGSPAAAGLR